MASRPGHLSRKEVQQSSADFAWLRQKPAGHLLSAQWIEPDDINDYCRVAASFESGRKADKICVGKTVALLFFQPSTRTRVGFEAAAASIGATPIGMEDMSASRSNERSGETLEDCAAVVSRLSDAIVVRHYENGAADRMAAKSLKPVINAGDGWNEHPSQALADIFALRRGLGTVQGKSIAFGGDPRGRTVRSLAYLLRHDVPREVVFCPPSYQLIPRDVLAILAEAHIRCRVVTEISYALAECDAIMMAPYDMSDIGEPGSSGYLSPRTTPETHVVTAKKLELVSSRALLYHPLPRHDEIDPSCDDLPNAKYFEQVRLSKFMRMAILEKILAD